MDSTSVLVKRQWWEQEVNLMRGSGQEHEPDWTNNAPEHTQQASSRAYLLAILMGFASGQNMGFYSQEGKIRLLHIAWKDALEPPPCRPRRSASMEKAADEHARQRQREKNQKEKAKAKQQAKDQKVAPAATESCSAAASSSSAPLATGSSAPTSLPATASSTVAPKPRPRGSASSSSALQPPPPKDPPPPKKLPPPAPALWWAD